MGGPHPPEALKAARREAGMVVDTVCFDKGWGFRDALIEAIAPLILLKDTALAAHQQVTAERDEARKQAGLTWTAPDIDAWGRHAEEKGLPGIRDRLNRLFRRAIRAEGEIAAADQRAEAAEASLATATSELARLRAEGEAKDKRIAELSETWTDEAGTVWSPPAAWAYAKACAALRKHRAEGETLRAALDQTKAAADDLVPVCIAEGDNKAAGALQFISGFVSDRLAAVEDAALARAATAREGQADG